MKESTVDSNLGQFFKDRVMILPEEACFAGKSPAPCLSALPWSSTAFTSAWQLISSATIPSTARRAARISGVVPSFILASRSVTRLRIRI